MILEELWQHHQNHLKLKKRSEYTRHYYRSTLVSLRKYQKAGEDNLPDEVERITVMHLRGFLMWLEEEQELNAGGIHAHGRALRGVFHWAFKEELISKDPVKRLELPSVPKERMPAVQPAQLKKLVEASKTAEHPLRDKAILLVLFDTGIRLGEITGLKIEDVLMDRGMLRVVGKGNKERFVPIGGSAMLAINRYMQRERKPAHAGIRQLFLGRGGIPLDRTGVALALEKLAKKIGLERKDCTPHTFRRGFAVQFLRNGGNLFALQQILGHTTLDMTRRYVGYLDDDIKDIHVRNSPVDLL
ncbi:tyrosine-type recombinase/integrase [Deinococcus roseus]|uniref:Integrase n=1 Tax=Deinococcus roseus TaxID=392414 RepID=A0ABQ2CV18_9DEIO|nr:tyrosine-type recombinase/integrase [Deinococcus roseus]GGJ23579.1 integrase [Deinococcus roseus]